MDERKFTICNLSVEMLVLKIATLKSEVIKNTLQDIMITIGSKKYEDEYLSESIIALELDDIYEFGCLTEPDDKDINILQPLIEALMTELPNYEDYKKKYNWK